MKTLNYTVIDNSICKYLDFKDTYRYYCLSLTPHKDGFTDSTFQQIMEVTTDKSIRTIQDFINRLRISKYIKIETYHTNESTKRNKYYLKPMIENFRIITNGLLELDLNLSEKGFLIQLFGMTYNFTNECQLKQKDIALRMGVSDDTVTNYTKKLVSTGHLEKLKTGFKFLDKCFEVAVDKRKYTDEIMKRIIEMSKIDTFKSIINSTKWENIEHPKEYLDKMEMGLFNVKNEICGIELLKLKLI